MKIGRNDPCPCGSGKKYKACCMAGEKAEQVERVAWERAVQDMHRALIGFAREPAYIKDLAAALGLFWQDRYTADTIHLMSADESLRFFDWFAHDYTLSEPGKRLIEVYRQEVGDVLTDKESQVLDAWIDSPPGSAFVLESADPETGVVVIRDLFLTDRRIEVHDTAAAKHGEVGQILLARPLIENQAMRLSGATAVLPSEEEQGLKAAVAEARRAYLEASPDTSMTQFLRERAYLFTHYALEWADREGRPAVSADDPEVKKPGGQAVKKLIKWSHERIQGR